MALNFQIPMPKSGADSLESGLKTGSSIMRQMLLTPAEIEAKQAEANKAQMMAKLIQGAMEGGQTGGGIPASSLLKGLLGIPEETPAQTRAGEVQKSTDIEQAKANQKAMQEALDTGDIVNKYATNVQRIHNLVNKKKNAISIVPSVAQMTPEEWGEFDEAAMPLVGKLGKEISQRGGAVAAGFAQAGKPGKNKFHGQNVGLTKGLIDSAINDYNEAKQKYERVSGGKPYPVKLHDFYQQFAQQPSGAKKPKTNAKGMVILYKDGKEYHLPPPLMRKALSEGFTLGD